MATPRNHTPRSSRPSRGPAVRKIAAVKGRRCPCGRCGPHMPWQRRAADVALEVDPVTKVNAFGIVVVSVPRQSGKTTLESDVADHRCLSMRRARVWLAMQNGKTADSWMREEHFAQLSEAELLRGRYIESRRAGEVGVKWTPTSSTFLTFPPKRDALHSKQSDLVFVDEAWSHNAEVGADIRQAIRPTMATRRGAQLWVVSTMGDDSSVYLDQYISLARASLGDPNARVAFIDYGIGADVDPEDIDAVAAAHPAVGHTIGRDALVEALDEFKADPLLGGVAGFARAYGNRPTRTAEQAISAARWAAAGRARVPLPDRAGIGLDATPSGDRAALVAGWRDDTTHSYVEPLWAGAPGRDTPALVVDVLEANDAPLVVDRASIGALELVDAIAAEWRRRHPGRHAPEFPHRFLTMAEYASACGMLYNGVLNDTVHHFNDPDLTASVEVVAKRQLGDGGFGWQRKGSAGSIAETVAASVALKAFDLLPAPRRRAVARAGGGASRRFR